MGKQKAIPCCLMRGGTSKGPFFLEEDLPYDIDLRDKVLLAAVGSPDERQIDGVGGAHPLTSKVGIVSKSNKDGIDIEFLFAQLQPNSDKVDTKPNCGNMLAAAVPFALEKNLIKAKGKTSTYRVLTRNTGMLSDITVNTPNGYMDYEGNAKIDGVPKTASPIKISFLDMAGSIAGSLLPTGRVLDIVEGVNVTCIDNGMPVVIMRAEDMGVTGYERPDELNNNQQLKTKLEKIRLEASKLMGLGDTKDKNYPKMCMISKPVMGGAVNTRCFIPHVCHEAIGVLAAVSIATACALPDSIGQDITQMASGLIKNVSVEHPSGEFTMEITLDGKNNVISASLVRTARLLIAGEVMVPAALFD